MSENTKIEWADHTFNPWEGCQKVGPGCDNCYAEARNARFAGGQAINWGPGAPRRRTSAANWRKPLMWNAQRYVQCAACGYRCDLRDFHGVAGPVDWTMCPACSCQDFHDVRARVFCASLADVFDNQVDPKWRADLFALIGECRNLDWLVLTKRIGNVRGMIQEAARTTLCLNRPFSTALPDNVWLGATIVNQAEADRDIPKLLELSAAKRFLSMEPLLGPVDLTPAYLPCPNSHDIVMDPETGSEECCRRCDYTGISDEMGIDWVIVGGESGPNARPMHPDWARSLRDQCHAAGVPFLFKQWGEYLPSLQDGEPDRAVIEINASDAPMRVGKKAAGRRIDGREWNEVPT